MMKQVIALFLFGLCLNHVIAIYPGTPMYWCEYDFNGNTWYSDLCGVFVDVNNDGLIDVLDSFIEYYSPDSKVNDIYLNNGCEWVISTAYNDSVQYCKAYLESKMSDEDRVIQRVLRAEEQGFISINDARRIMKAIVKRDAIASLSRNIEDDKRFFMYALAALD